MLRQPGSVSRKFVAELTVTYQPLTSNGHREFARALNSPRCSNQAEVAIRTGNWAPLSIGSAEEWPSLVQTTRITAAIGSER